MTEELAIQRVDVTFVQAPPARLIERASGVTDVQLRGPVLHCLVHGSFQALRGYEVISLTSTPTPSSRNAGHVRETSPKRKPR